ncbi:MAG: YidC/Oxa1 family membrane protein insertase [Deltaproteobacteria bacterium]|nr:YidC/Oxa1 family membrane protein insertase [Deltaproteobacteria bacterium]
MRGGNHFTKKSVRCMRAVAAFFLSALSAILVSASFCYAIPSPDVVVNLFASAGQLLGLVSVLFGTAAVRRSGKNGSKGARSGLSKKWLVALGIICAVSVSANVLQYSWQQDEKVRRLERNLIRPSTEQGKKVGDTSLKTLSYSDQLQHPAAISTEELARLKNAEDFDKKYTVLDVRASEEVEMGMIGGAIAVPQPDLRIRRHEFFTPDKTLILMCDSGNRSGELCAEFLAEGQPCRFMMGGFEKWLSEERPLENAQVRAKGAIRDIPDYPNKTVLLDTPEVEQLLQEKNAIFVDVRYPGDFELGHLPGAINIPLRKMTTDEMWEALKHLPKKPVIAACYDKRSCFFSMLLGLRLHRLGYEYLGRYTVPHEFMQAKEELAFVQAWREANQKSLMTFISAPFLMLFDWLHERITGFALCIIAFVALLRLFALPFGIKSERDTMVENKHRAELETLKDSLKEDPARMGRAVRGWYRKHSIRPGITLIGSMIQVLLFIIAFAVVQSASKPLEESFLWLTTPREVDFTYILPVLVSLLFFAFMVIGAKKKSALAWTGRALATGFLFAITFQLWASLNFYLVVNLTLLLAQTIAVKKLLRWRAGEALFGAKQELYRDGIFPLSIAHKVEGAGAKAARLGQMLEAGIPVPNGFVITESLFSRNNLQEETDELRLSSSDAKQLVALRTKMKSRCVAVRSSGLNEDGSQNSYAGVFESILNVKPYEFGAAVQDVRASLSSNRVLAYSGIERERGGILVQEMIDAQYAGVVFTEHPAESGAILVELVEGLGDALVSGDSAASAFRFGRLSHELLDNTPPPIDLQPLLELGKRIETLFAHPQDIEWAYADGKFIILQARNITRHSRSGAASGNAKAVLEEERSRLLQIAERGSSDEAVFVQNELSALLPRPTPLSLSLMERLRAPGGSTDLACRELGIPYGMPEDGKPLLVSAFGALYTDRRQEAKLGMSSPGFMSAYRLGRSAGRLESEYHEQFVPSVEESMRLMHAVDFNRLSLSDLIALLKEWGEKFITRTYVEAEKINLAAELYMQTAKTALQRKGLEAAKYLASIPHNETFKAFSLLPEIRQGLRTAGDFLAAYGHRSPYDYELSSSRYEEDPQLVEQLVSQSNGSHQKGEHSVTQSSELSTVLSAIVERACKFQALKEDAKHFALKEMALIRKLLVAIGARMQLFDDVFYLTLDELTSPELGDLESLKNEASQRKKNMQLFCSIRLPAELKISHLENLEAKADGTVSLSRSKKVDIVTGGTLTGILVAGDRVVEGSVRVVLEEDEMVFFRAGEILVTRFTNPKWTPLFSQAGGIITEVGGWLSHAAILAREFNLPTIVGVSNVLDTVETGDKVRLCADGTVEVLSNEH